MTPAEINEELSASRIDLERAEDELGAATEALTLAWLDVEFTRAHIQRLEARQRVTP